MAAILARIPGSFAGTAALSLFVSFSAAFPLFAGEIPLAWPPASSKSLDIGGYRIYIGTVPDAYFRVIDVGSALSFIVTDIAPYTTYYFAATAYNDAGEGPFNNKAWKVWFPPSGPKDLAGRAASGSEITLKWKAAVHGGETTGLAEGVFKKDRPDMLV